MRNELKDCPFCGSSDVSIKLHGIDCFIECKKCEAKSGESYGSEQDEVISKWNRRAISASVASAAPSGELPPLPEMEGLQDIPYARETPADWDEDYRATWQKLQVAELNKMQWRSYALQMHTALEEIATEAAYSDCPSIARAAIAHQPPKEALSDLVILMMASQHDVESREVHDDNVISFARAIESASAPNKQLVAALQEIIKNDPYKTHNSSITARAALASVGVEVGK